MARDKMMVVVYLTELIRILQQYAKEIVVRLKLRIIANSDLNTQRFCSADNHLQRLRKDILVDKKSVAYGVAGAVAQAMQHGHRFGRSGSFIQQRSVGNRHGGQVRNNRLKIEQRFQSALRDFGLIGCILCVPSRIFENRALDDAGHVSSVIAKANIGTKKFVGDGDGAHSIEIFLLALAGGCFFFGNADICWNGLFDQFFPGSSLNGFQHLLDFFGGWANVAILKQVF
jgi:hypothetical protein